MVDFQKDKERREGNKGKGSFTYPISVESCCLEDEDDEGNPSDSTLKRPCGTKATERAKSNLGQENSVELTDVVQIMWTKKNESDSFKEKRNEERYERAS